MLATVAGLNFKQAKRLLIRFMPRLTTSLARSIGARCCFFVEENNQAALAVKLDYRWCEPKAGLPCVWDLLWANLVGLLGLRIWDSLCLLGFASAFWCSEIEPASKPLPSISFCCSYIWRTELDHVMSCGLSLSEVQLDGKFAVTLQLEVEMMHSTHFSVKQGQGNMCHEQCF